MFKPAYETAYIYDDRQNRGREKRFLKSAKRADIQRMRKDEEMENGCY
jgi:hypothetical protein